MATNAWKKLHAQLKMAITVRYLLYLACICFLFACKEAEDTDPISIDQNSRQVLILNEGNFRSANASLSIYYPEKGSIEHHVFKNNNQNRPLGDVVQSISKISNRGFVVVNNSSKIEVVDWHDFTSISTISGLNSPRYILPISNSKAYVSDLYEDKIYILNPQSLSIIGTIDSKGWTEEMVLLNDKAFVCQMDSNQVLVINTQNDSIIKKISTNKSPSSIGVDQDGKVWVACTGGIQQDYPAIHIINSMNFQVEKSMEWPDVTKSIHHLSFGPNGRSIYYIMGDVFHMELGDSILSSTPLIPANGRNFYGLGIDSFNGDIYVSDALDYQQKGVVYRFDNEGKEVANFKAGLIPANFFFN